MSLETKSTILAIIAILSLYVSAFIAIASFVVFEEYNSIIIIILMRIYIESIDKYRKIRMQEIDNSLKERYEVNKNEK